MKRNNKIFSGFPVHLNYNLLYMNEEKKWVLAMFIGVF